MTNTNSEGKQEKRHMSIWHRIKGIHINKTRITLILFITAVVLIPLSGYIYIKSESGREFLRETIINITEKKIRADIDIKSLTINPFSGISLHEISIHERKHNRKLISADSLCILYSLYPLLKKQVMIKSVKLSGLSGDVSQEEIDETLPESGKKDKPPPFFAPKVIIDEVIVDSDLLIYRFRNDKNSAEAKNLSLSFKRVEDSGFDTEFEAEYIMGFFQEDTVRLAPVSTRAGISADSSRIDLISPLLKLHLQSETALLSENSKIEFSGEVNSDLYRSMVKNPGITLPDSVSLRGEFTLSPISASGRITTDDAEVYTLRFDSSSVDFSYLMDTLNTKVRLSGRDLSIDSDIEMSLKKGFDKISYNSSTTINTDSPESFITLPFKEPVSSVTGNIRLQGDRLDRLPESGRLRVDMNRESSESFFALKGDWTREIINSGQSDTAYSVDLRTEVFSEKAADIRGRITSDMEMNAEASIKADTIPDLLILNNRYSLKGEIIGSIKAHGKLSALSYTGQVEGDGLYFNNSGIDYSYLEFSSSGERIRIDSGYTLVSGSIQKLLPHEVNKDIKGYITSIFTYQGTFDSIRAKSVIGIDSLSYRDILYTDRIDGSLFYRNDTLKTDSLVLRKNNKRILCSIIYINRETDTAASNIEVYSGEDSKGIASGSALFRNDTVKAHASVSELLIESLSDFISPIRGYTGTLNTELSLSKEMKSLSASVSGSLKYPGHKTDTITDSVSFSSNLNPKTIKTSIMLFNKGDTIHTDLFTPMQGSGFSVDNTSINLYTRGFNTNSLSKYMGKDIQLNSVLSSEISALYTSGTILASGFIDINKGMFIHSGRSILSDLNLRCNLTKKAENKSFFDIFLTSPCSSYVGEIKHTSVNGRIDGTGLTVEDAEIHIDTGKINFNGFLPFKEREKFSDGIEIHASAETFPVKLANPFMPENSNFSSGFLNSDIAFQNNTVKGKAEIDTLKYNTTLFSPSPGPANIILNFRKDTIELVKLNSKWGEGRITGSGKLLTKDLIHLQNGELNFDAENISFTDENTYNYKLKTASVDFQVLSDSVFALIGNAYTGPSTYHFLPSGFSTASGFKEDTPPGILDDIILDINLDIDDNLDVTSSLGLMFENSGWFETRIGGVVSVRGSLYKPVFSYNIYGDEGELSYLGSKFTLQELSVTGAGSHSSKIGILSSNTVKLNNHESDSCTIYLRISGSLNTPQLDIYSDPSLPQSEIMSLLIAGSRSYTSEDMENSGFGTSAKRITGSIVSKGIDRIASNKIEDIFNMEEVEIQSNLSSASFDSTSLSASKRLSDRFLIRYEGKIGNPEKQKGIISLKIMPFLYLEGEASADGNSGIDIKFKYNKD